MSSDEEEISVEVKPETWNSNTINQLLHCLYEQSTKSELNSPFDAVDIDWNSVSESVGMDPEKCSAKWTSLLSYIRTYRTFSEILLDLHTQHSKTDQRQKNNEVRKTNQRSAAKQATTPKPDSKKKSKKGVNPDHPKLPAANGYSLFCKERFSTVVAPPGVHKFGVLSGIWKDLPKVEKDEYAKRVEQIKADYTEEVKVYAADHPEDKEIQGILQELLKKKKGSGSSTKRKANSEVDNGNVSLFDTTEEDEESNSPRKKLKYSPKKQEKKVVTAESVYIETKIDGYREEHPDRDEDYIREKLKRKFARLSDEKKAKFERLAKEEEETDEDSDSD